MSEVQAAPGAEQTTGLELREQKQDARQKFNVIIDYIGKETELRHTFTKSPHHQKPLWLQGLVAEPVPPFSSSR